MNKLRTSLALITPSVLSIATVLLLSVSFIAWQSWAYINHKQLFYETLFGSHGVQTQLISRADTTSIIHDVLFNDMLTYQTLLVACAIGVGCLTYMLIRGLTGLAEGSATWWGELRSRDARIHATFIAGTKRIGLRFISLLGWIVYTVFFVRLLLPLCTVLVHTSLEHASADGSIGWALLVISTAVFAACLYMHVIFMRTTFLRVRLFGGMDSDLYLSKK
jgi:hypothetical protein